MEFAKASLPRGLTLDNLRIAVDVANGAGYKSTPWILRELGADVLTFHNNPDGTNINRDCGSTHPSEIQLLVRQTGAGIGITHDGDADRVLLCDEKGQLVDGDEIMAIAAREFLRQGRLADNTLVATVMSNYGLEEALGDCGGKVIRTQVGDRYVIEAMVKGGLNLGGEQSGHMIFRDFTTTGDGIITALQILRIMRDHRQAAQRTQTMPRQVSPGATQSSRVAQTSPFGTAGREPAGRGDRGSACRQRPCAPALFRHRTQGAVADRGT